jgi:hypothetical protein
VGQVVELLMRYAHGARRLTLRPARVSKAQLKLMSKVDLDAVQDAPSGPQDEFEDWCEVQDIQFDRAIRGWR